MPEMMHIALVSAVSDRMADLREQIEAGGDMRVTVFAAHAPGLSVDEAERTRHEHRARPVFTRADKAEAGKRAGRHGLARGRVPEFCRLRAGTGLVYST